MLNFPDKFTLPEPDGKDKVSVPYKRAASHFPDLLWEIRRKRENNGNLSASACIINLVVRIGPCDEKIILSRTDILRDAEGVCVDWERMLQMDFFPPLDHVSESTRDRTGLPDWPPTNERKDDGHAIGTKSI